MGKYNRDSQYNDDNNKKDPDFFPKPINSRSKYIKKQSTQSKTEKIQKKNSQTQTKKVQLSLVQQQTNLANDIEDILVLEDFDNMVCQNNMASYHNQQANNHKNNPQVMNYQEKVQKKEQSKVQSQKSQNKNPKNIKHNNNNLNDNSNSASHFNGSFPNNNNPSNSNHQSQIDQDDIEDLRMIQVDFFTSIGQPNGLVFKPDTRKKLNRQHQKRYYFTPQHDLDPEIQEVPKIMFQIQKMKIFNQAYQKQQISQKQWKQFIEQDIKIMIYQFKQASYIYCKQVTHQLYKILRTICDIIVENHTCDPQDKNSQLILELREFGNKICSDHKANEYFFFGYQFFKLNKEYKGHQLEDQLKKDKNKYVLHPDFRKPNTQFASFTEKVGLYFLKQLQDLNCFASLK